MNSLIAMHPEVRHHAIIFMCHIADVQLFKLITYNLIFYIRNLTSVFVVFEVLKELLACSSASRTMIVLISNL